MTPQERIEHVRHWLALKQGWDRWREGEAMPSLPEASQKYFERRAGHAVGKYVEKHPDRFRHTAAPSSDRECWAILMEYLLRKRPKAHLHLIDHIFESAFLSASKALEGRVTGGIGVDQSVEQLLNRFNTQVILSAMGDYLRQHRPPPRGTGVRSMEETAGDSDITLGEILSGQDAGQWWETEVERHEVEELGRETSGAYFTTVRPAFRLSLFLRGLRQYRCVTISCAEPKVLAVAGIGRAVFADGAVRTLGGLTAALGAVPAILELDPPARLHATHTATETLTDAAETWFFTGQWIADCCREQQGDSSAPADGCAAFQAKAEALALLIRERLRESGKILAENEMTVVFLKLTGPAACP